MVARYLITGAQGFVGRYLVDHLIRSRPDAKILGLGRSPRRDRSFTHRIQWGTASVSAPVPATLQSSTRSDRYRYTSLDLLDKTELRRRIRDFRPDTVVHLAAALRASHPDELIRANVTGTICLVEAIAQAGVGVRRLVLGSSGGVYGTPGENGLPLAESAPCSPIDLYSASKLASEHVSRILATSFDIPAIWARIFNLMGPGLDERHVCARLAAQVAAINQGRLDPQIEIGATGTTRDFIDVRDACRALSLIVDQGQPGQFYNVARGIETSVESVLQAALRTATIDLDGSVRRGPGRKTDVPRHFADIRRLSCLGFAAHHDLEGSVADMVAYYQCDVARGIGILEPDSDSAAP